MSNTTVNNLQGAISTLDNTGDLNLSGNLTLGKTATANLPVPNSVTIYTPDGKSVNMVDSSGNISVVSSGGGGAQGNFTSLSVNPGPLNVSGQTNMTGSSTSSTELVVSVSGDTAARLAVNANGVLNFGSGSAATDTNLYRAAPAQLQTDSAFQINGQAIISNGVSAAVSITGSVTGQQLLSATGADVTSRGLQTSVTGDTIARFVETVDGTLNWGPGGSTARDTSLSRNGVASLSTNGQLTFSTAGKGLTLTEGSNAKMGVVTLAAGTATVSTTAVTANSRIFLTAQSTGAAPGALRISTITAGTSFVITSTSGTDTSSVAWLIIEHA